jgi:hypothetical protein
MNRISKKAVFAIIFYLIIPTIAISLIIASYPELSKERLTDMLLRTIPVAILLIIISQFGTRYEKGDKRKFILNEIYVLLVLLWLFALLGGQPVISQTWGEHSFSLNLWNFILLILFVSAINATYFSLEYLTHRSKKVEGENPEDGKAEDDVPANADVGIAAVEAQ